jgi:inner membrane protein
MIIAFYNAYPAWFWGILGLVLMAIETVFPGIFLLWIGLGALLTAIGLAVLTQTFEIPVWSGLVLFVLLTPITVFLGWRWTRGGTNVADALNQRSAEIVGHVFVLTDPTVNGEGFIHVNDSLWRVLLDQEPHISLPAGTSVRVVSVEGAIVKVRPVA